MVAFARMAVFFDALVLSESLLFALGAALLWTVARAAGRAVRDRDACGAPVRAARAGRATAALLVLPRRRRVAGAGTPARGVRARAAAVAAAFALVCAPAAWRNAAVSGEWIPFTYNAGYNLYVGNHPDAQGGFAQVTGTHDITDLTVMGEDGGIEGDGRSYIREVTGRDMKPPRARRGGRAARPTGCARIPRAPRRCGRGAWRWCGACTRARRSRTPTVRAARGTDGAAVGGLVRRARRARVRGRRACVAAHGRRRARDVRVRFAAAHALRS